MRRGIAGLFENGDDAVNVIKWKDVYSLLEETVDAREDVGDMALALGAIAVVAAVIDVVETGFFVQGRSGAARWSGRRRSSAAPPSWCALPPRGQVKLDGRSGRPAPTTTSCRGTRS